MAERQDLKQEVGRRKVGMGLETGDTGEALSKSQGTPPAKPSQACLEDLRQQNGKLAERGKCLRLAPLESPPSQLQGPQRGWKLLALNPLLLWRQHISTTPRSSKKHQIKPHTYASNRFHTRSPLEITTVVCRVGALSRWPWHRAVHGSQKEHPRQLVDIFQPATSASQINHIYYSCWSFYTELAQPHIHCILLSIHPVLMSLRHLVGLLSLHVDSNGLL